MPTNARIIAFQTLMKTEALDAFLNLTLDGIIAESGEVSAADKALATELSYGVFRRRRLLDVTIGACSSRPPEKMDLDVLTALRIGCYQLFFTRTKLHAAVNESVELVKTSKSGRSASGFVNALMRRMAKLKSPVVPEGIFPAARIGIRHSQPTWLVDRWIRRFGEFEAESLCQSLNETPGIHVRIDPSKIDRETFVDLMMKSGVTASSLRLSPVGLSLNAAGNLAVLDAYREGMFQVQDEAAQLVGLMPSVSPGMKVLDACAAPGGKTCHLAQRLKGEGKIVALDLHAHRLERLKTESKRLGLESLISCVAADASGPLPFEKSSFDLILADLPCTGLGTTRRHPEIRYRRTKEDPDRMSQIQRSILKNIASYLRPGGQLVFSVCSMEPEEGLDQVAFIQGELGFDLISPDDSMAVRWPLVSASTPAIATFPHVQGCDGFFGARFEKRR